MTSDPVCGSYVIDSVLTANNKVHQAFYAAGEGHEYWGALNGEWLPSGPNAFFFDIIDKTALFFYEFMRPSIPIIVGPDSIQQGQVYTYSISNSQPGDEFCWDIIGGTILQSGSASVDVYASSTSSNLIVTAQRMDRSDIMSEKGLFISYPIQQVSVNELEQERLRIYPNPVKDILQFEGDFFGKSFILSSTIK